MSSKPNRDLLEQCRNYGFVEVVRALATTQPETLSPGTRGPFSQEKLRFSHNSALEFGSREINKVERTDNGEYLVQANILGMSGEGSPVPLYLVQDLAIPGEEFERSRAYLDVFHHRLYALLFRGLNELDLPGQATQSQSSPWIERLSTLLGLDGSVLTNLKHLSVSDVLRLAPLLATHAKSRPAIEKAINLLLTPYLTSSDGRRAKAYLHDFEGDWTKIDQDNLVRLNQANHRLGHEPLLGKRVRHRAAGARIEIRPLQAKQQEFFETGGKAYLQLGELLSLCISAPIRFELDLRLLYENQDHATLGRSRLRVNSILPGSNRKPLRQVSYPLELPSYKHTE